MILLGLTIHAWITILLVLGMFLILLKTKIPADVVFLSVMALLLITGCLSTKDALSGFSATSVVVIGVMFIVVAGLEATGVLQWIVRNILGVPSSYSRAIIRLMLPVAFLSSLLSNTTVVALFINVVKMWVKKLNTTPSKFLIPLSYAASLGGVCTLIGTPPNLIVSGFYADLSGEHLGIFATTLPGVFCLVVGILTIILLQRLLPIRKSPEDELGTSKLSTTELHVMPNTSLPGLTLGESHILDDCKESQLIGIVRFDGEVVKEMVPEEFLMGGDTLIFAGDQAEVLNIGRIHGLKCDIMLEEVPEKATSKTYISSLILLGMVLLSAFDVMPLLNSCMVAALLMLLTRCCNIKQAKKSLNWDILMVFACSVSIGQAIEATGIATLVANNLSSMCGSNALVAFIIVCTLGTFLTEFVSNVACAAILAPVAIQIATLMGANPLTFCMGLMVSCSCSFATPIGTASNLMVYVPGGYRFSDYARIGLPMNFIILAANIFICCLLYPL